MKLSFSSNAFVEHSLDDALTTIAGIGYQGVPSAQLELT